VGKQIVVNCSKGRFSTIAQTLSLSGTQRLASCEEAVAKNVRFVAQLREMMCDCSLSMK
jgi:hypothetical protein